MFVPKTRRTALVFLAVALVFLAVGFTSGNAALMALSAAFSALAVAFLRRVSRNADNVTRESSGPPA
jgi:membrane protein implicated in regulation of membrane protease activity